VVIKSNSFDGLNRLQIHRLVMELLKEEILQIHAFSLEIGRV
jgi:stress-induced morphogen